MAEPKRSCELCNNEATVYCASDAAYLCFSCDAKVHSANFLVARHFRSIICSNCRSLSDFPGKSPTLCRSCSPEGLVGGDGEDCLSSCSSSCVSSTTEEEAVTSRKRERERERKRIARGHVAVDLKVEGVLGNWCRRLPVDERRGWEVVTTAVEVLGGCLDRMTVLPFRVALAASFWVAMRVCCCVGNDREDTCRMLRRLEQISGVPAKLILATESRLARVLKRRRAREDHEEGWAES